MARNEIVIARLALGIIFFWFGVLKFFPGQSAAENLASRTISVLAWGHVPPRVSMPVLAAWECAIGLGFLSGRFTRATLVLLLLQLPGTFMPLVFFPHETWKQFPYAPTLEGQYIIKNLAVIAAGMLVGATMRGGRVIADPGVARQAERFQGLYSRFRRRFRREPEEVRIRARRNARPAGNEKEDDA